MSRAVALALFALFALCAPVRGARVSGFFDGDDQVNNMYEFLNKDCGYGINCGSKCVNTTWIQGDPLDKACYDHDRCLDTTRDPGNGYNTTIDVCRWFSKALKSPACSCDRELSKSANAVIAKFGPKIKEAEWDLKRWRRMVAAAKNIQTAMVLRLGCNTCNLTGAF